ncbi:MAG TPA: succinate dehydrogenase, hydrophobic membrane anchor protein [Stellaceae bacterium]|nr:succinate dehydrogenase, hydrophobic membrane anchor protein [Stellaceae bacterium]
MTEQASLRSPLGKAIGLGSAKEGVVHWWRQRLSAVALVPLALWFVASLIAHLGGDRAGLVAWLHAPVPAILMILLVGTVFYHTVLGVQVVIEDYVHHEAAKLTALIVLRLACFLLAVAGIFAVLRLAFGA